MGTYRPTVALADKCLHVDYAALNSGTLFWYRVSIRILGIWEHCDTSSMGYR